MSLNHNPDSVKLDPKLFSHTELKEAIEDIRDNEELRPLSYPPKGYVYGQNVYRGEWFLVRRKSK